MYKFTNGIVVFTEEDKEAFIKAGYVLVEEKNEDKDNDRIIAEEPRRSKKTDTKLQK